jgi:hypothetical protein
MQVSKSNRLKYVAEEPAGNRSLVKSRVKQNFLAKIVYFLKLGPVRVNLIEFPDV